MSITARLHITLLQSAGHKGKEKMAWWTKITFVDNHTPDYELYGKQSYNEDVSKEQDRDQSSSSNLR